VLPFFIIRNKILPAAIQWHGYNKFCEYRSTLWYWNGGDGGVATDSISLHKSTFCPLRNLRLNEKCFNKAIHAWYSEVFLGLANPETLEDASSLFRGWRVCVEDPYIWRYDDLTNSMEVSPSWVATSSAAHQEIPRFLWNRNFITVPFRSHVNSSMPHYTRGSQKIRFLILMPPKNSPSEVPLIHLLLLLCGK
jgi:hypothetical protein